MRFSSRFMILISILFLSSFLVSCRDDGGGDGSNDGGENNQAAENQIRIKMDLSNSSGLLTTDGTNNSRIHRENAKYLGIEPNETALSMVSRSNASESSDNDDSNLKKVDSEGDVSSTMETQKGEWAGTLPNITSIGISPSKDVYFQFEHTFVYRITGDSGESCENPWSSSSPCSCQVFKLKDKLINKLPFPTFTYKDSLENFGCDKPDLRNPLRLANVTNYFEGSGLQIFENLIKKGAIVNCIQALNSEGKPRSFYDNLNKWAQEQGKKGLGYINFENSLPKGPLAKNFNQEKLNQMIKDNNFNLNDGLLFVCDLPDESYEFSSKVISKVGEDLNLIDKNKYEFCWIVDYPMYEKDVLTGKIDFSHNPFSMPQGGMDALTKDDPLNVLAYQYDIVCNGIELSSGAIRNHRPDIMKKAFEIAGYGESEIKSKFSALFDAFHYGVPPHGGCAPGLDRIIMLLSENENIREVIAFPFNQRAQDLMMNAPVKIEDKQLKELNLKKVSD